jgi:hypothetical protein
MLKPHRDREPVQHRRFQDASIGENTPESRTTIGEGRQRDVTGAANRVEVLSDQPFDVCPGLRDSAENLTAAGFRFDIANPHFKPTFSVLAAPYEGGSHGDRDRRRAAGGLIAAQSASAAPAFRVWRRNVVGSLPVSTGNMCSSRSALTRYVIRADRCARSRSSSGVERQCNGQLMPVSMRPHAAQRNRGSLNVTCPNSVATAWFDNLSPGKSRRGRGKPAAGPPAPSPARRRSRAEPARAAVSLP